MLPKLVYQHITANVLSLPTETCAILTHLSALTDSCQHMLGLIFVMKGRLHQASPYRETLGQNNQGGLMALNALLQQTAALLGIADTTLYIYIYIAKATIYLYRYRSKRTTSIL